MNDDDTLERENENPVFDSDFPVWTITNNLIKSDVGFVQSIELPTRQDDGAKLLLLFTDEDGAKSYLEDKDDRHFFSIQQIDSLQDAIDICQILNVRFGARYVTIDFYRKASLRRFFEMSTFVKYLKGKLTTLQ